ncbi:hypothetical protein KJB35_02170 [Vibrio sp. D431a]|nr:hypothetical protein [Vibrio sp. D431a]
MFTNKLNVIENGSTYTLKSPENDTVRLTIEDSDNSNIYVNISCHRTSCHFVVDAPEEVSGISLLKDSTVEHLMQLLFPSHLLWEFDVSLGVAKAQDIVSKEMSSNDPIEVEEFWDENNYSLHECKTREDFAKWVSRHVPEYDLYDALDEMTFRRYTPEAKLIAEEAIPLIKCAIQFALLR